MTNEHTDEGLEAPRTQVEQGFAVQAARLLEAARQNERAVRDLEEAVEILGDGVGELAACEDLAEALGDLAGQAGRIDRVARAAREACDRTEALQEKVESLTDAANALAQAVGGLDARLNEALAAAQAADPAALAARMESLESKVDRLADLIEAGLVAAGQR